MMGVGITAFSQGSGALLQSLLMGGGPIRNSRAVMEWPHSNTRGRCLRSTPNMGSGVLYHSSRGIAQYECNGYGWDCGAL